MTSDVEAALRLLETRLDLTPLTLVGDRSLIEQSLDSLVVVEVLEVCVAARPQLAVLSDDELLSRPLMELLGRRGRADR